jgi:hypothetical protein
VSPIELYHRANSGSLSADEVSRLVALAEAYPYFALPHLIQARQAAKGNGTNAQAALAKAAVYSHNRRKLAGSLDEQYAVPGSDSKPAKEAAAPTPNPASQKPTETNIPPVTPPASTVTSEPTAPKPATVPETKASLAPEPTPAVRFVPKESIAKPAPTPPPAAEKTPEVPPQALATPEKAPLTAQAPQSVVPAGPERGIDQKLQTVLNIRVGMYVPLAAQLAAEAKSYQAQHAPAAIASETAVAAPTVASTPLPEVTSEPVSESTADAPGPETHPKQEQPSAASAVQTATTAPSAPSAPPASPAETIIQPDAAPLVRTVISKNAPVAPRTAERKVERVVERRPAIGSTSAIPLPPKAEHVQPIGSDTSALESKIAAMIAEKAVSIDSKSAAPTPLAPARGPGVTIPSQPAPHPNRPAGAHPALSGAMPLAVKATPPAVVAKAPFSEREAEEKPQVLAPASPPVAAAPIAQPEAKSQPERERERNRPDPQDKLKAPWERRIGPREDDASAGGVRPTTPLLDQPMDSGMDQLRRSLLSMIQTQISEAYDPATPAQTAPAEPQAKAAEVTAPIAAPTTPEAALAPEVESRSSGPPAASASATPSAAPPAAPAKPAGTSLRGTSESMRRFVSPEFEGGVRPVLIEAGVQAEAPSSVPASSVPVADAAPLNPELHRSTESMRRFVQPDFTDESRRSALRAETTGSDRPAALPLKDPAGAAPPPPSVAPAASSSATATPALDDDIKGGNSMRRFAQPDFSLKPATLHLDRPEREGIKTPPLAPPRQPEVTSGAEPASQSDSFKRFVAPSFDTGASQPTPIPRAPEPPAAPTQAPVVGDSSASFKRFVSPDFTPAPSAKAPIPSPDAAPEPGLESGSTSESMKRFSAPDFGTETLVERMEHVHGQDLVIPDAPLSSDTLREAASQLSNDKLEESFMRGGLSDVARGLDPVRPTSALQPQSVAETLASIQLKDTSGSESLGQVLADVSEQSSISSTGGSDITERIESFRQNLAKLRTRSMPNPSEINLRTIQQKFLDRIVQATGRSEGGTPAAPTSNEPPKSEDSEGERSSAGPENSVVTLVGRFKAFEPRLAESLSAIRQNPDAFAKSAAAEPEPEGDDTGEAVASETLARILWQQGQADKARRMVEQLALNQPEKSAYFAALLAQWG